MHTNNIANRRRIDVAAIAERFSRADVARFVAAALLTVLLVTFRPFQTFSENSVTTGGDAINQLGFGLVGVVCIFAVACLADRRMAAAVLSPSWLLLLLLLLLAILNTPDPSTSMRAGIFTVIAMSAAACVVLLPRDGDAFASVLIVAASVVLTICYLGVTLYPSVAIHGGDGFEPQHDGFWRGSFSHKNIAGPVMASLCFAGLYLMRRGSIRAGAVIFVAAVLFMANTGSKTTVGLVPMVILLVALPPLLGLRFVTAIFFVLAIVGTALGTIGIVFIEPVRDLVLSYFPDLTFTGRTALWAFSGEMIQLRPWRGYGYENFWGTPFLFMSDQPFDREWDIRGIVHGHNGYLDIAVTMGLPALAVAVVAFIITPVRDYLRVPPIRENIYRADFFMMLLLFTCLNAFLESFFFRRADPVWLFLVMGAIGLRLAARFPYRITDAR